MTDAEYVKWIRSETGYRGSIWIKRNDEHHLSGCVTGSVWISGIDFAERGPDMQTAASAVVRELKAQTEECPNCVWHGEILSS